MKAGPVGADAGTSQRLPLKLSGAADLPAPVRVVAQGQRADGTPVLGEAAYFAQGAQVFQAVIYAKEISPEAAETFFSSFKFQ
jgi:hypothetical protein